jgi:hypothetical protein
MNWIDLVIIVLVVIAAFRGRRVGALRQVARLIGLGAGFVIGTLIAPSISLAITHARWRPVLALVLVFVVTMLGSHLGFLLGGVASKALHIVRLGVFDSIGGIVVSVLGTLVGCWLVAGLLGSTAWGSLATEIQGSKVLRAIDKVMPPVPSFDAKVQSLFRSVDLPNVFASVIAPTLPVPVPSKELGPSVSSLAGPSDVVKVIASGGCSRIQEGTAFFVTSHEVVTNAHVVAGQLHVAVNGAPAQVALYDPYFDIAVLRVPTLYGVPLHFWSRTLRAGTRAQVIGFPLNGTRTGSPAYIEGEISAQTRDIYDGGLATRSLEVLEANIRPGNSGSPVLAGALVDGIVESTSLSQASTGYAIPNAVIERDIAKAPANGSVSTQSCVP